MKKLFFLLTFSFVTALNATTFVSVGYGQTSEGHLANNNEKIDREYLKVTIGRLGYDTSHERIAPYIDLGSTQHKEAVLGNLGISYAINNHFYLLGGIGISKYIDDEESNYEEESKTNGNINIIFINKNYGFMLGYDSDPKLVSANIVYRF